ncbi:MAG: amidohydrolase [Myxococcales bacterium]|nr:amidohydrolase [Myxococcales bacterium]
MMRASAYFAIFLFLVSCGAGSKRMSTQARDTNHATADDIYLGGVLYTMDPAAPSATAMAVKDGRILAVGNDVEMAAYAGPGTVKHALKGAFVMPGFIDGHAHLFGVGTSLTTLTLREFLTWEALITAVAARAATAAPGEWILGRGWHQEKWAAGASTVRVAGYPTHDALSRVTAANPVVLRHASGHALLANAAAMAAAGITAKTPDPAGGHIVRDASGNPTGIFEENAMDLINVAYATSRSSRTPAQVFAEERVLVEAAQQAALALGITTIQDAGSSRARLEVLRQLAEQGALRVRVWAMLDTSAATAASDVKGLPWHHLGNRMLTVGGIKVLTDGALGSHGARLREPYADRSETSGRYVTSMADLAAQAEIAATHDLQLCVHAIGDLAIREVLDVYEQAFARHPSPHARRWRVEHAQHVAPPDLPRFAALGVLASVQPIHAVSDAPFVEKRLGYARTEATAYPWRRLIDAGAKLALGTDAPVEALDPFANLHAAVTRARLDNGEPFFSAQVMTRQEALFGYTMGNAYAAFEEADKGSLTAGKLADFIIVSENLATCSNDALRSARILATYVGGVLAYRAPT